MNGFDEVRPCRRVGEMESGVTLSAGVVLVYLDSDGDVDQYLFEAILQTQWQSH